MSASKDKTVPHAIKSKTTTTTTTSLMDKGGKIKTIKQMADEKGGDHMQLSAHTCIFSPIKCS